MGRQGVKVAKIKLAKELMRALGELMSALGADPEILKYLTSSNPIKDPFRVQEPSPPADHMGVRASRKA